jgi:cytidyltransferase-like protein
MADLLSKLVEAVTSSAAGGERSARNIGVPGYPVPPEMRPEDPVDEATVDPLPKSIQHLDDLSPDEFIRFLDKYRKLPLEGGLEVSEKVDGSARMSFGVENGRLWTKSKNGPRRHASTEYPKSHVWDAIRMAHRALESHREKIVAAWPPGPREFVCEILFTHVPNSIEYGPNVIMVHGVVMQDTQVLPDQAAKRITNKFIGRVGNKLSDGKDTWLLEYKRVIPHDQLMVDVEEEFQSLDDVRKELKKIRTHGPKQAAMARFKDIQLAVKDKLLDQMRKQRPTYGKDGGDIEGLVFRDLESGQMVKLVDRDFFTSLNKFMWFYRELLGRGVKVGEKWVPGIGQRLKNYIAEEVMGSPVAKTSQFVSYLQRNYGKPGNPEELDTLIARYVQDEGLMRGDFLSRFRNVLEKTEVEFEVVKRDWESRKDGKIIFRSKDGREREMSDVVKARTQAAFDEMEETISGMQGMVDVLEKMPDELTQKVGLVKIMLGQNGLEKLAGDAKVKDTKKMHEDAGQPTPVFRGLRGLDAQALKRLGGDPSRQEGQADLDGVDKKGYWSANPKIALVYATTAATAEREGPFMAILRGSYSGATKGSAQAINPGNPVGMEKIYWASNPAKLKTFNLTEAGSVGPKKLSPEKATQMAQVVQDNAQKLAQRKIDVSNAKPLGVGGNGVAFDLGQTVLKVTKDDKEANSSMVIKGKDFPNIVKVFDVFRFPETPYFGIWQEKLQPIPPQDKNEFTEFVTDIEVESGMFSDLWKLGDWKEIVDYAMEGAREDEEATPESIARIRKEIMVLQRKYQMDKIVAQLKAAKIQFRDFHGGNVMMRGSEHVLIDLGYSKSPKQQVANLESIVGVVSNLIEAGPPPIPASQRKVPKDAAGKALGIDTAGAKNFINRNLEKLAKKGINGNAAKQIGQGTRGVAFDIGNNRVLKISNDVQEAIAANKLKEFNLKHVVRFFDVFRFPEEDPKLGHVYGVVQEKLIPLGGADSSNQQVSGESAELNNALIKLQLPQTIYKSGYDWDRTKQMVAEFVQSEIKRKYPQFSSDDIDRKYAEKYAAEMNGYWKICTQKFHIGDMVQELSAKGVKFHDYHAGNIMKRPNGEYVLIDIGYSKVAGGKEPGVLERVMEAIIEDLQPDEFGTQVVQGDADLLKAKKGIDISKLKFIAAGGMGAAYDMGGGKVLKITSDPSEAVTAQAIKGKNLEHIYRVYDVFRFKEEDDGIQPVYAIVQEKLFPIRETLGNWAFSLALLRQFLAPKHRPIAWEEARAGVIAERNRTSKKQDGQLYADILEKMGVGDIVDELAKLGIVFFDYHPGNIMKRADGTPVVIDLGVSTVPNAVDPPVLERVIESFISELSISGPVDFNPEDRSDDVEKFGKVAEDGSKADTVGVTIGRFQPFHKGHAEIIRKLATKFTKVVIIVAGNRPDAKNPFSYELRRELMEMSLPDVEPKLEVYKAEVDGKATGYLPGILNRIIVDKDSSVEYDTAITILVGPDRYDDVKRMISTAKKGDGQYFDPGLAVVEKMPDVTNDDQAGRISGTQVRAALVANKKDQVGQLLDPHVLSDKTAFDDIYQRMRDEMSRFVQLRELREDASNSPNLDAVGGVVGMGEILAQNADVIQRARGIDVTNAKILGNGQMGVAFEVPGNRVLKLTTDHEEAKTAAYLKGKSKDHITKFFDVFGLKATKDSGHPVYCVLEEKLVPLDENEQREFNDFAINYLRSNEVVNTTATKPFKDVWEKVREVVINDVIRDLGLSREIDVSKQPGHDMAPGVVKRVNRAQGLIVKTLEELKEIVQKYQIDKMVDELREMNIQFADFHGGNVMKRGQNYVINDLGKSKSPGVEPPQIEMIVREFVELLGERPVGGVGGGYGDAQAGVKAGSSGWSSSRNMTDKDEPEDMTWQEMIPDPNLKMRP